MPHGLNTAKESKEIQTETNTIICSRKSGLGPRAPLARPGCCGEFFPPTASHPTHTQPKKYSYLHYTNSSCTQAKHYTNPAHMQQKKYFHLHYTSNSYTTKEILTFALHKSNKQRNTHICITQIQLIHHQRNTN